MIKNEESDRNALLFIDTLNIVKWMTAYSGYWVMLLLGLFSYGILPMMTLGFSSFVDANHIESPNDRWLGWYQLAFYTVYVIINTFI